MKTVLLIAGFCRPNKESCISNINSLKNSFKDKEIETVYVDDSNQDSYSIIQECKIDNSILIKKVEDSKILEQFPNISFINAKKGLCSQANIFRFRQKIKLGIDLIKEYIPDCTHICLCRPCLKIDFDTNFYKEGLYNVLSAGIEFVDDGFGWANKEIFNIVWDYKDKQIFNKAEKYELESDEEFVKYITWINKIDVNLMKCKAYEKRKE